MSRLLICAAAMWIGALIFPAAFGISSLAAAGLALLMLGSAAWVWGKLIAEPAGTETVLDLTDEEDTDIMHMVRRKEPQ